MQPIQRWKLQKNVKVSHADKDKTNIFFSVSMLQSRMGSRRKNMENGVCPVLEGALFVVPKKFGSAWEM